MTLAVSLFSYSALIFVYVLWILGEKADLLHQEDARVVHLLPENTKETEAEALALINKN